MKVLKLTKRVKEALGISLLLSAISLVVSFIVLACRKKSLAAAVLALAATQGALGAVLLGDATSRRHAKKERRRADEEEIELFDAATCRAATARVHRTLDGE